MDLNGTITRMMKVFVDDGFVVRFLRKREFDVWDHISFSRGTHQPWLYCYSLSAIVSITTQTSIETCVYYYIHEAVTPIIRNKFLVVQQISVLVSYNPIFNSAVIKKGNQVSHPSLESNPQPFGVSMITTVIVTQTSSCP